MTKVSFYPEKLKKKTEMNIVETNGKNKANLCLELHVNKDISNVVDASF